MFLVICKGCHQQIDITCVTLHSLVIERIISNCCGDLIVSFWGSVTITMIECDHVSGN